MPMGPGRWGKFVAILDLRPLRDEPLWAIRDKGEAGADSTPWFASLFPWLVPASEWLAELAPTAAAIA